jgi:isopentenyl-diphosphate delta-isomerase
MIDALEKVILVDENDRPLGQAPKLEAHERGDLHRAFSVLVHDDSGSMLLQKRHPGKYHSGGLWTNACCGHPRPGEATIDAASRRLQEEMGIDCKLVPMHSLIYRADVGNGLVEHEFVHIFSGVWHGPITADPREAEDHAWRTLADLQLDIAEHPQRFTAWFRLYIEQSVAELI